MNDELQMKRDAEARTKALAEAAKQRAKEQAERAKVERAQPKQNKAATPNKPQPQRIVNREGLPVNSKGEVSALWWLGMGL